MLVGFEHGAIDARGQSEIVSIDDEPAQVVSLAGQTGVTVKTGLESKKPIKKGAVSSAG